MKNKTPNDIELLEFTADFRRGIIGRGTAKSMCFVVCAPLETLLVLSGFDVKLVEGEVETKDCVLGHYWLELKDGRILDPTADQFENMPKIYIGEKPEFYKVID